MSTLPRNVFPVDWALDIAQIPATTRELDPLNREFVLLVINSEWRTDGLYPKIREICNSKVKTFVHLPNLNDYRVTTDEGLKLISGMTISVTLNGLPQVSSVHGLG